MSYQPLTELARQALERVIGAGDLAIDATVGNGYDTLFLARRVAPGGRVVGFDIQPGALEQARKRLDAAGLAGSVTLLRCGHEEMAARVPADWAGRVAAVMFNLGYLPGGDKALVTRPETTVQALEQARSLLRVGGVISLMVYRGHPGAGHETTAVDHWLGGLDTAYRHSLRASPGPLLHLIERLR